jgi:hypothetical protein
MNFERFDAVDVRSLIFSDQKYGPPLPLGSVEIEPVKDPIETKDITSLPSCGSCILEDHGDVDVPLRSAVRWALEDITSSGDIPNNIEDIEAAAAEAINLASVSTEEQVEWVCACILCKLSSSDL